MSPDLCALAARDSSLPLAGTARTAAAFVLIQHEGPWSAKAVAESPLIDPLRPELSKHRNIEALLIRRGERRSVGEIIVVQPVAGRIQKKSVDHPDQIAGLDLAAVAAGADLGWESAEDLVLVCTNGKRDRCCAQLGRPIFETLQRRWPRRTWEVSHIGGHRFAGNVVTCPEGWFYGYLDPTTAIAAIEARDDGHLLLDHLRGRAGQSEAVQYAEIVLRKHLGYDLIDGLVVTAQDIDPNISERVGDPALVIHFDVAGAAYTVRTQRTPGEPALMSCRDDTPKPWTSFRLLDITVSP